MPTSCSSDAVGTRVPEVAGPAPGGPNSQVEAKPPQDILDAKADLAQFRLFLSEDLAALSLPLRITHCGQGVFVVTADGHEVCEVTWQYEEPLDREGVARLLLAGIEALVGAGGAARESALREDAAGRLHARVGSTAAPPAPALPAAIPSGAGEHPDPAPRPDVEALAPFQENPTREYAQSPVPDLAGAESGRRFPDRSGTPPKANLPLRGVGSGVTAGETARPEPVRPSPSYWDMARDFMRGGRR